MDIRIRLELEIEENEGLVFVPYEIIKNNGSKLLGFKIFNCEEIDKYENISESLEYFKEILESKVTELSKKPIIEECSDVVNYKWMECCLSDDKQAYIDEDDEEYENWEEIYKELSDIEIKHEVEITKTIEFSSGMCFLMGFVEKFNSCVEN